MAMFYMESFCKAAAENVAALRVRQETLKTLWGDLLYKGIPSGYTDSIFALDMDIPFFEMLHVRVELLQRLCEMADLSDQVHSDIYDIMVVLSTRMKEQAARSRDLIGISMLDSALALDLDIPFFAILRDKVQVLQGYHGREDLPDRIRFDVNGFIVELSESMRIEEQIARNPRAAYQTLSNGDVWAGYMEYAKRLLHDCQNLP
ncbi:hypothetical protein BGX31_003278 [Mortierella sp. GBA43]|nr:hypothetical protein BGX31_003278 [Mortierella sp. GBA43]